MAVRFLFDVTFVFAVVVSLVMSDSDLFSIPETGLSLNDGMLAFDQSASPMNFDVSPQDGSDLLFGNLDSGQLISNGDEGLDDPLELAECSSSNLFPALGKSRMKQRDRIPESEDLTWRPPNNNAGSNSNPPFDRSRGLFGTEGMMFLNRARERQSENSDCKLLTMGALNFGVCHTGEGEEIANYPISFNGARFVTVNLRNGSPPPELTSNCVSPQKLYCCARAYYDLTEEATSYSGNYHGDICISLSALLGGPQGGV